MRYSKQREVVKEVTKSTKIHPDAEWIYHEAEKSIPNISLGTVYRNLKELVEKGELVSLETEDNVLHYDGDVSPHAHFICRGCNKIYDLPCDSGVASLLEEKGYEVACEKLLIYGKCPSCKN